MTFNKRQRKNASLSQLALAACLMALAVVPDLALAQTNIGGAATTVFGQFKPVADVIMGILFLAGLGVGGASIMKFKAHSENPQQHKIGPPIGLAIAAACLVGFPAYINMTKDSFLQGEGNNLNGGAYDTIGNG